MSVSITQEFTDPATGLKRTAVVTLDVTKGRLATDTSSAQERSLLQATSAGKTTVYIDIDKVAQDALSGRAASGQDGHKETYMTASRAVGQTTLPVLSHSDFAAKDVIAIMDDYDGTNVEFAVVTASAANLITISEDGAGVGLTYAHKKGSIVQNLKTRYMGNSLGSGGIAGIKTQLERPFAVTGQDDNKAGFF